MFFLLNCSALCATVIHTFEEIEDNKQLEELNLGLPSNYVNTVCA